MYEHMRVNHWSEYKILKYNCPLCETTLKNHQTLDEHLVNCHGVKIEFKNFTFDCLEGKFVLLQLTDSRKKYNYKFKLTIEQQHHFNFFKVLSTYLLHKRSVCLKIYSPGILLNLYDS